MYNIQLIPKDKILSIIPFLQQLNPKISKSTLEQRLQDMIQSGYECVGVYEHKKIVGISGLWFLTKYYVGKHVEPDNVYILPEYQGKGLGKLIINWIFEYAKSNGCMASELNCYTDNKKGQKFWNQMGYELVAYHYQKKL